MTTDLDSSLRRPVLNDQDRGNVLPDSNKKLSDDPQLIIESGIETFALKFEDQKGLTDDYGNVYDGYGGAGGSSLNVTHDTPGSIDGEADDANDLDFLQYDGFEEKYLPRSYEQAGLPQVSLSDLPSDGDMLEYNLGLGLYVPKSKFEMHLVRFSTEPANGQLIKYNFATGLFDPLNAGDIIGAYNIVFHDGTAPAEGNVLVYKMATGNYHPQAPKFADFAAVTIEVPQNKVYSLAINLPYDITITGNSFSLEAGPGSVAFPSGIITAGSALNITVSGTTGASKFLKAQITFTRAVTYI